MDTRPSSWLTRKKHTIQVPAVLESAGVLMEPLSIVEKAIEEALRLQMARCPEAATTPDRLFGRKCLVAGLGRWDSWRRWSCACAAMCTDWTLNGAYVLTGIPGGDPPADCRS
jgi:hypothetical protein